MIAVRARLDGQDGQALFGKEVEQSRERTRLVPRFQLERQRVAVGRPGCIRAHQQREAREVAWGVLQVTAEHEAAVEGGGVTAGDGRAGTIAGGHDVAHGGRGVRLGVSLPRGIGAQEFLALRQRCGCE